ncbi:hypothetical protein HUT13_18480 [Streptomyces harbinensis]|nr:hypothetical protein HUT13_18480 [Streptomyces harbinensis]
MRAAVPGWPRYRRAVLAFVCALASVTLTACGGGEEDPDEGTNGLAKLTAEEIEQEVRGAVEGATAVRLSGTVITEGTTYRLDMRIGEGGGVGEVSTEGTTFELLRVGEDLFIKADAGFWQSQDDPEDEDGEESADPDPAHKLDGKYVRVAPEDPAYGQLSGFTDRNVLLDGLLALEGERAIGERGELGGVQTIRLEAGEGAGGAMEISLIGTPYPLRFERGGAAGELTLTDWNKEFTLHAPPEEEILDYGDEMVTDED